MKYTDSTTNKKKKFLELIKLRAGNVSATCEAINIDRGTYYLWIKKDKTFKQAISDIREALIDYAESQLMILIKEKEPSAIYFFLKTQAKSRGYIERSETEHSGNVQIYQVKLKE